MARYSEPDGTIVTAETVSVQTLSGAGAAPAASAPWQASLTEAGKYGPIRDGLRVGEAVPVHAEYTTRLQQYTFLDASYRGGPQYKNSLDSTGSPMLYRHEPNETEEGFKRRKKLAVLKNHCRPIIRKFNSYVFRQDIRRDGQSEQFTEWCNDVDLQGAPLADFMRRAMRRAQVFGRYFIGVDTNRPATISEMTRAQADAAGVRMFLVAIDPRRVLDWRRRNGKLTEALVVYDNGQEAVLWTRTDRTLILLNEGGQILSMSDPTPHGFEDIPVVEMVPFEDGDSQIVDIAELQRDAFNMEALLREEIFNTTFTQYWAFGTRSDVFKEQTMGPSRVMCLPNPDAKIDTTGGDPAQAQSIRGTIADTTTEIYRLAGLKAEDPLLVSPAKSGVALKVEFDDLDAILSAIADEAERAENEIVEFYNQAANASVEPTQYPDTFGTPDITVELGRSFDVMGSPYTVQTSKRLESRRLNALLHPKASPEDRQKMDEESLELFPEEPQEPAPAGQGGPGTANPVEAARKAMASLLGEDNTGGQGESGGNGQGGPGMMGGKGSGGMMGGTGGKMPMNPAQMAKAMSGAASE